MGVFSTLFRKPDPVTIDGKFNVRYLEKLLSDWLDSPERKEMLVAEDYYDGRQDILKKERTAIGSDGTTVVVANLPNNILIDNQYRKCVDQKTNYALAKPLTIASDNDEYTKVLSKVFTKNLNRKFRRLAKYAINCSIAYAYPYVENGKFNIKVFAGHEVMPVWKDRDHDELLCAVRWYKVREWNGSKFTEVERVEVYGMEGVDFYERRGTTLIPEETPFIPYLLDGDNQPYNWGRLPIIPFKYNDDEIPLIRSVKCLQDSINEVLSNFQDNLQEDPRNTILILENYDGTNLAEFRQNLSTYGAVKVHTVDGVKGGVSTLQVEVNAENYQAILMQLKRALVENARGFDAKEERMDGDPNQMNIQSMYSDIDLDVDGMENSFQCGFETLIDFINQFLLVSGEGDFTNEKVEFIFNRNIMINESDIINNCVQSSAVISEETIIAHHPWVVDVAKEKRLIAADKNAELEEMSALSEQNQQPTQSQEASGEEGEEE